MKKQQWILLAILLLLCTVLTGCQGKEQDDTVTIGYFNNITHAQALLMKADGSLKEALGDAVSVNWVSFNAGPAEVEAIFSGDIDIGYIGPVPAISANVKSGGDVQILAAATQAGAVLVRAAGEDISDAGDLSGKTVAIPQIGNTQHLVLLNLLAENGLQTTDVGGDVTVAAISNADVANALERGDIDAALVPEPWGATLLEQGAELVLDEKQVYQNGEYDVAVVIVRREFYEAHPEIVEIFLREHEAATVLLNSDKENVLQTINAELERETGKKLSEAILSQAFERIGISTQLNKSAMEGFAKISMEQGFIDALPSENLYPE